MNWQKSLNRDSMVAAQVYHDWLEYYMRFGGLDLKQTDISFQHRFQWAFGQELIWGAGYRYITDDVVLSDLLYLADLNEKSGLLSVFVRDEFSLTDDRLTFILGSHFEKNDFSGWEIQFHRRPVSKRNYSPHCTPVQDHGKSDPGWTILIAGQKIQQ